MTQFIEDFAFCISVLSMVVISYGSILAMLKFVQNELSRVRGRFSFKKLNTIKINFSYYLLLGLDFLIAADVIRTIVENTLQDLTILGVSVLIRTILSFFLGKEMKEDTTLRKDFEEERNVS